ncbi:hypothetical protein Adt_09013 [Abeliophyllum distichum]|uniref:Receptor-interacting protein n=1 Tax=Abeliophyllum distichum TaxID=126358 RepID=A0ABD1UFZ8_9LAMI
MNSTHPYAGKYQLSSVCNFRKTIKLYPGITVPSFNVSRIRRKLSLRACAEEKSGRRSFLTIEEAGLVEVSGLSSHERFLCRLTISSLNLLRVISEQEGCSIEELNAGKICDWFVKDKLKREQNLDSAVLKWDDSEFLI